MVPPSSFKNGLILCHLGLAGGVDEEVGELPHDVGDRHQPQLVNLCHTQLAHLV